jgi:hypothetical protein
MGQRGPGVNARSMYASMRAAGGKVCQCMGQCARHDRNEQQQKPQRRSGQPVHFPVHILSMRGRRNARVVLHGMLLVRDGRCSFDLRPRQKFRAVLRAEDESKPYRFLAGGLDYARLEKVAPVLIRRPGLAEHVAGG